MVLNAGRFVAPTILAFAKLAPVTVAPEKFALVSVAPANDTPIRVAPTNDAPDKSAPAKLVPGATVCPTSETVSALLVTGVGAAYWLVASWDAVNVTLPAVTNVITPVLASIVATLGVLLPYMIAPSLALFGAGIETPNGVAPYAFSAGTVNADKVGVPSSTVSSLLVTLVALYWVVASWDAVNVAVPALTRVITPVLASIVATLGLLVLYTINPSLSLLGAGSIMLNGSLPYVLVPATENAVSDVVSSSTVSSLLVTLAALYWVVASWDAVKVTVPALTRVITPVLASIVAMLGLLLEYVIAPSLALFGAGAVIANGASPYVFDAVTTNVDSVGTVVGPVGPVGPVVPVGPV